MRRVGTVAVKAIVREDWPDLAVEFDLVRQRRRFLGRQNARPAEEQSHEAARQHSR
jgi:hypothetical protein